jgi:hypothetical protein
MVRPNRNLEIDRPSHGFRENELQILRSGASGLRLVEPYGSESGHALPFCPIPSPTAQTFRRAG